MEEMYGEQYHLSYSSPVIVLGSRIASASAGFVHALRSNCLYSPGWPAIPCAMVSGTRIASSSAPPVVTIPVIVSGCVVWALDVFATWIVLPIAKSPGSFTASEEPITASSAPPSNHRPWIFHEDCVALRP